MMVPFQRGSNSTFMGGMPMGSPDGGQSGVGWSGKGRSNMTNPRAMSSGPGQGMGGGGSSPNTPAPLNTGQGLRNTLMPARPTNAGGMGPGVSYPRASMPGMSGRGGMGGGFGRMSTM